MKLDDASKISTIVIGLAASWFAYKASSWDDILKAIETTSKTEKFEQEKLTFDREFKFKIYQITIDAIKSEDSTLQDAAYVTVNSMVTDTAFKTGLLNLFVKSKSVTPTIRKAATVAKFDIRESKEANPVYSPTDKIYVDIIYSENAPRAKSMARKILNALQSSEYYEVGMKPLPVDRQKLPAYKDIEHNLIRYDTEEKAKAEKLREVVNQILPEGVEPFIIEQTAAGKPTVQYISLFVIK